MYRTLIGVLAAFGVALSIVGLTFSASVDKVAAFRFINGTEPKTLDPHIATGQPEGRIVSALFEGLTRFDAKTLHPAPGVAESWTISGDGKTYTFRLRHDARWSDGHPVLARDFVYSWKRLLEPSLGSEYAYILYAVRYAEELNTFEGHADALKDKIMPALQKFSEANATGVDAKTWQRFLAETNANDPLRHAGDARVEELLTRRSGRVEARDLSYFREAMVRAEQTLRKGAGEARAHFGVDGGIFAPDDYTVVVELDAPTPYFLEITSFHSTLPVPRWIVERPGRSHDWFLPEYIVSNGPFTLKRWLVNDRIRLERNDLYWGKREVRSPSIDVLAMENSTTSLNLYLTGEVDWLPDNHYPMDLVDQLKKRSDFYRNAALTVYYYRFNTTRPPLTDARVRQALNLAVDRKLIVDDVLGLGQIPAYTFVPPGLAGYDPPETGIRFDVPRARALLAEAGYPGGRGFPEIGILYNTLETHKKIAEVIADQLRRNLGIRVNAYNQEWQSYQATVQSMDYTIARAGWVGDYNDPNTFLDMWVTNGGNNSTGFSSPLYDRLIRLAADVRSLVDSDAEPLLLQLKKPDDVRRALAKARTASDEKAKLAALFDLRMRLFREAEAILFQDQFPIMPIYFYVVSGLVRPKVRGLYNTLIYEDGSTAPNMQDVHPLRDIWVE